MIAIVLAGGYARRLRGFTNLPKPLLSVKNRPIIDHMLDKLAEIEEIQRIIISTNLRFKIDFEEWLGRNPRGRIEVKVDRSWSEEDKPGALSSLAQIVSELDDDCLMIAGDNVFTASLRPMAELFRRKSSTVVALFDVKDLTLARQYSVARLDADCRIRQFDEKPPQPDTTLVGTCIYMLPKDILRDLVEYSKGASDRDNPGSFISWLCKREPVYGYVLSGNWWDIGTPEQHREANDFFDGIGARANDYQGGYSFSRSR